MVTPGEGSQTATVLFPTQSLLSQESETLTKHSLFKQDVKQATGKGQQHVLTHGLHCTKHFSCDSPTRFMMYFEAAAAFISLHADNTACIYKADGYKLTSSVKCTFAGLTSTKISSHLVGWGPGPTFALLDRELRSLHAAHDALDIRVCQPAEHSTEVVTAGVGNVCVWSVMIMRCKVRIQEGLQHSTLTHMALAPPRSDRPHRAFVVCRQVVTVVDLDDGKVLDHKKDLCSCDITAIVYSSELDCLIISSRDLSISVWGPEWMKRSTFGGHDGVVTSLFYCSGLNKLLSASVDCTIRCWNVKEGDIFERVHTEPETPPLCIGGTGKGDIFFSFSHQGVDFWSIRNLYSHHCKLPGDEGAPLRQISASLFPAPYPVRVLCVSGDSDVTLVSAETGAVLTSFKAQQKILCADYCLHKEILLALTEAGTVLQANTLTNPITLMQVWKRRGQGPWQLEDHVTEHDVQHLPAPGPACCLVLYSYVAETQGALEEWKSLQDKRGFRYRNKATLDDANNRFLIMLGQTGGCVSVLKLDNGKVLYRTMAHGGQRVTTIQAYPESGYLLSTGEDMTVVVWRVKPYFKECLSQQRRLHCGQPQVYMAALGPQMLLTFQEPSSTSYSLMHFNLLTESQTGKPLRDQHLDRFTGLCACPDLKVFVSSSLDGTVCIWSENNQLIRTLQLNAVPECLSYGGFGGQLFLGIRGDLYRMNCAQFLPHKYQPMLLHTYYVEPLPDLPILEDKAKSSKRRTATKAGNKEDESPAIGSNQLSTEDTTRHKENTRLVTSDLSALVQGTVTCKKGKPPSTKKTKMEAFDRYMEILYGLPHNIKIDLDDNSYSDTFSFHYKPKVPSPKKDVLPESVNVKKRKQEKKEPDQNPKPQTPDKNPKPKTPTDELVIVKDEEPPEIISPIEHAKTPPVRLRTPALLPSRDPSPELPTFIKEFADEDWFRDLYPDKKSIPNSLTAEDFSLKLLACLNTCSTSYRIRILAALQVIHNQGLIQNIEKLYQGLTDLVPRFVRPHMSSLDRRALVEMLKLLLSLRSVRSDLMKNLLPLLAYKKLGLQETLLRMLTTLGVDEAEQWLLPELDSWSSELQDQSDMWTSLHGRADCWLELWISKYQDYNRYQYLRSTQKWKPLVFSMVDVLNYFCSVQKEYRKAQYAAPAGRNNTVLLPEYDCSEPILRLGETYTMSRTRRPPGIILPPLRHRPFLMHFPNLISLPLTRVTLCPFHVYSEEDWVKTLPRRYFIPQQSIVEYYR